MVCDPRTHHYIQRRTNEGLTKKEAFAPRSIVYGRAVCSAGLEAAQLHGDEPPEVTAVVAAGVETVIKVVAAESPSVRSIDEHAADIVLLDAPIPGGGVPFEWGIVGDLVTKHKILLAAGLRPDNVAEAVRRVQPWGVDVASGVEAELAQKDPDAIARFMAEARAAAEQRTES
jgi:phosphoribosylanthranilate isomerase